MIRCFLLLVAAMFVSWCSFADDLRVGAASVKVTPPVGTPMAGYYYERGVKNIHDDIFAKAMVIENGKEKVAIVECDFVSISEYIVAEVRKLVQKSVGLDAAHVMIGATHSHTGPIIPSYPTALNIGVDPGSSGGKILAEYIARLPALIAKSIEQANANLVSGKLSFGFGHEGSISFNRRYFMTDGTVGWNPGLQNPKIIKPAGPIDSVVDVLYAESAEGRPISTFVNFALHLDEVGGSDVSADLPFTLSTILGKVKGSDMVTIFSQGCSGNINHINVKGTAPQSGNFVAERNGAILAGEVIKTYARLSALNVDSIKVSREIIPIPLVEISKDEMEWARKTAAKFGKPDAAPFLDLVKAFKMLDVEKRNGQPLQIEIQVIAFGDQCAIVSFPDEIFTELGTYLKSRSPYPYTIISELTNGSNGYIPDRKAYMEGNYEPISTRAAAGSGEILVENALRMLKSLKSR